MFEKKIEGFIDIDYSDYFLAKINVFFLFISTFNYLWN